MQLGLEIGYLLSARFSNDGGNYDVSSFYNRIMDLGAAAGVSYSVSDRVNVEARYIHGFSDMVDENFTFADNQDPLIDDYYIDVRNRVFQLSLAYRVR